MSKPRASKPSIVSSRLFSSPPMSREEDRLRGAPRGELWELGADRVSGGEGWGV